jgi:N-acetylneuraminic acid mutarotase
MGNRSFKLAFVLALFLILMTIQTELVSAYSENTWETKTSMPNNAYGDEAVSINGKIYIMNGFSSNNNEYDPLTDNWTSKTPMPNLTSFTMVSYQNKIYCIDALTTEIYDPLKDSWETKTAMPISITGKANIVNGEIYVISGYNYPSANQLMGINEVYNIANNSWTTKKSIPYPVSAYASTVCDGKIYIIGGQDPALGDKSMNVDFTQIYDPSIDAWSMGASMPTHVLDPTAGATKGVMAPKRIYLFGGFSSDTNFQSIDYHTTNLTQVYDPENNSWTYGAQMLSPRTDVAVVNVNDKLYVLGGSNVGLGAPYVLNNEVYKPLGYHLSQQTTSTPTSSIPEMPYCALLVVLIFGVGAAIALVSKKVPCVFSNPKEHN